MNAEEAAELRSLRERAYGRHPDIAEDPAALWRLRELERRATPAREKPAAPPPPIPPEEPADAATVTTAAEAEDTPPESVPEGPPRRLPRILRGAAIVVGVVALVAATAGITATVTGMVRDAAPLYPGATVAETLVAVEEGAAGSGDEPAGNRRFEDFRGFSVFVYRTADGSDYQCLSIVSPAQATDPSVGQTLSGCGTPPFPTSVTVMIGDRSPRPARDALADGTVVNFTLTEDGVEVALIEPSPEPAP
jgi:hypothetical protein